MKRALALTLLALPLFAQIPYTEKPTYARSHDFDLQHVKLELSFALPAHKLLGTATLRVAPLAGDVRELALDSVDLDIEAVTVTGRSATFHTGEDHLYVTLDRQYPAGTPIDVVIKYHTVPRRGMFFVFPDAYHPDRPKQIWANGDTAGGNNRYWFPGYDFPNDKTTTEMLITVPSGWQAISNGKLVGSTDDKRAAVTTFHWLQDKPMSTYLISLVAGEFDKREDKWTVPVEYYVPRGRAADVPRTDGRTGIRQVDEGNIVHAASSPAIVVITQLKPISVIFNLPQQDIGKVTDAFAKAPLTVEAQRPDNDAVIDRGVLRVVDNQVDQTTGTIKLKAEFPNAGLALWPGQFVNVRLLIDTLKDVVVIPTGAVQRGPNGTFVYVVKDDNTAAMRPIVVQKQDETQTVVKSGLTPPERVVTTGFVRLTDGSKVTIGSADGAPAATPQSTRQRSGQRPTGERPNAPQ